MDNIELEIMFSELKFNGGRKLNAMNYFSFRNFMFLYITEITKLCFINYSECTNYFSVINFNLCFSLTHWPLAGGIENPTYLHIPQECLEMANNCADNSYNS